MPKKEIQDYIFYKIVCLDDSCELIYVGSTVNWKARNYKHKSNCTNENGKKYNTKVYKTIRANGGWDNFKMIQIGTADQLTVRQAEEIEDEYRVELKATMNGRRCYVSEEQKQELDKEYKQKWYQDNIEKVKEYKEANKDKIKEYNKKYSEANKEQKKAYDKEYKEVNKDKIKEHSNQKIVCECGCDITRSVLTRHKKTQKHINLMAAG